MQKEIDFDRAERDRIGERIAQALQQLELGRGRASGWRQASPATAAAVFRELAWMIGKKEGFRVGIPKLAERLGRAESTVRRALGVLTAAGLVESVRTGRRSLYVINWQTARDLIAAADDERAHPARSDRADEPARALTPGRGERSQ